LDPTVKSGSTGLRILPGREFGIRRDSTYTYFKLSRAYIYAITVIGDDVFSSSLHHHDILMIHVESTGSVTSDHKVIESIEHSYYTNAISRGREESFGYPLDRSVNHL